MEHRAGGQVRLERRSPLTTPTPLFLLQSGVLTTSVTRALLLRKAECFLVGSFIGCLVLAHMQGGTYWQAISPLRFVKHSGSPDGAGTVLKPTCLCFLISPMGRLDLQISVSSQL